MRRLALALSFCLAPILLAEGRLTQFSVIDALLAGVYDGPFTVADLQNAGNIGLGTFNALDGELLMVDGVVYQIAHSGKVSIMPPEALTPFAVACAFQPQVQRPPPSAVKSLKEFDEQWRSRFAWSPPYAGEPLSENYFYAVTITGKFDTIKARSVPKQEPPYKPLAEVVADQNIFNFADIEGTMIGFYCPPFAKGVNVPGWHFHFISTDRKLGGHVLDFSIENYQQAELCWQMLDTLDLQLPEARSGYPKGQPGFPEIDLNPDRAEELDTVERSR